MELNEISVIICAYTEDRWEQLLEAIESVKQQTLPVAETIVVIDYNPHLYQRLRQLDIEITVLENQWQKGLSGSRNTGISYAIGDMIAFLDDDAVASPGWLAFLYENCGDNVLGVGAQVLPIWESKKPVWFPDEFYWIVGCSYLGLPKSTNPVRNLMGGAMCIRREIFTTVGDFRYGLGHLGTLLLGCEETELCIRARQYWPQFDFIYEPRSKIYHNIPSRRARFSYFCSRCYSEGISKALVAEFVGSTDALSSERDYTFNVLPRGVVRGLIDALHGDIFGLTRAGAIILGLGFTSLGYIVGIFKRILIHAPNRLFSVSALQK